MIHKIYLLLLSVSFSFYALAQSMQKGSYTVDVLADGVYHIEDANDSNPAGIQLDENGKMIGMNNCSDMYLFVGKEYVYDMRTLIERIRLGIAETENMSSFIPFLDTNFKFGTATITWNKEAAARYADSVRAGSGD